MTIYHAVPRSISALLVLAALGCASGPPPVDVAPGARPAEPAPQAAPVETEHLSLRLPDAAVRTAQRVELDGRELGTMWTFENPPLAYWQEEYGFNATQEWLDHVRLASVRYGEYCSASFVSPDGLVMTNHHCARECVEANSTPENDHVESGFYAATRTEERVCPGLYLDQLVAIEDVTSRVKSAVPAGAAAAEVAGAIAQATTEIEEECNGRTGNTCQVVPLFQGGQYQMYEYHRYEPVKLVFAPELQAGFFGGDPDNFTYPRYALDVSFVRAYEQDGVTPATTPEHFDWREEGADEDELVFITGNPGSTSRLITVAHLMYERIYRHPFLVQILGGQRAMLEAYAAANPEEAKQIRQDLFEIENSLKAYRGQYAGLRDSVLVGTKIRWEREFREKLRVNPSAQSEYGDVWDRIEEIQRQKLEVSPRLNVANPRLLGSPHLGYAGQLVEYVRQMARPEADRSRAFTGQAAMQIRTALESASPADPILSGMMLQLHLAVAETWLPADDPLRQLLLRPGESADQAAERLARTSRVLDPAFRREIIAGGVAALDASDDPLVVYAREANTILPVQTARWQEIQARESAQRRRLAEALFAVYGTSLPPDATFTLRISDGRVQRYEYNGTFAPPVTTLFGLYARASEFGNEMPWTLPDAFAKAASTVRLATPVNFVATTDITGGNSGSPVIDREGRVVGLAFDGNIEQLPNEFVFRADAGRTIGVHSAGILEALRSVYRADALLQELLGAATGNGGSR